MHAGRNIEAGVYFKTLCESVPLQICGEVSMSCGVLFCGPVMKANLLEHMHVLLPDMMFG